ncbi:MAG: hypothetical protein C5B48_14485 [Candidatus Rokuibacteriota bacterium]|nr:MAG: hypothetical protein C5B48_14485 [Candidatus Rokubacteria bacterium]
MGLRVDPVEILGDEQQGLDLALPPVGTRRPPGTVPGDVQREVGYVYELVITMVNAGEFGESVVGLRPDPSLIARSFTLLSTTFLPVATFAFLFVFEIGRIVGPRTMRNIVLGRYHRPRLDEGLLTPGAGRASLPPLDATRYDSAAPGASGLRCSLPSLHLSWAAPLDSPWIPGLYDDADRDNVVGISWTMD